jgi:predicted regulator of Ras-like GTPase activity (Roadblock/LC7/MglB family)
VARVRSTPDRAAQAWCVTQRDLCRELERFVERMPYVTATVAVSADGLLLGRNDALAPDIAERLAAIAAGLVSLLNGAARSMRAAPVVYNLTEMRDGYLFSMAVPSGASLFALAGRGCDIGLVGQQMANLIDRVGPTLNPPLRQRATPVAHSHR